MDEFANLLRATKFAGRVIPSPLLQDLLIFDPPTAAQVVTQREHGLLCCFLLSSSPWGHAEGGTNGQHQLGAYRDGGNCGYRKNNV